MAIIIEATYAKKLGLPGYSSHSYSVTIRSEIPDITALERANSEIYQLLQAAVDSEITKSGFVPDGTSTESAPASNGNGGSWSCSDKQRELIEKIVTDNHLDKKAVEELAQQRFGIGVKSLNKLQASGLIEEMLQTHANNRTNGKASGNKPYSRR